MDTLPLPPIFSKYLRHPLLFPHLSPIERLDNISRAVNAKAPAGPPTTPTSTPISTPIAIFIKRDDCNSGLAFGGNKLRALEYIVPEILGGGYDIVVVEGGVQSNTVRLVKAVCAKVGIECRVRRRPGSKNWSEPSTAAYQTLGNIQIIKLMAPLSSSPSYSTTTDSYSYSTTTTPLSVPQILSNLTQSGKKPYHIPAGTSGVPLAGLGYARLAFEILQQEKERDVFFDTVVVAAAGVGTVGGMLAGFRFAAEGEEGGGSEWATGRGIEQRKRKLIAVFVGSDIWSLEEPLRRTERVTMELLRGHGQAGSQSETQSSIDNAASTTKSSKSDSTVTLDMNFSFNAGGYGLVDAPTIRAMKMAGSLEGLILDPVYTGKAFACLLGRIERGEVGEGGNILFLHTGGQSVISAYEGLDLDM